MDQYTHPGKGLSLSQLAFALNQELKHAAYSPSYVAKYHRQLAREALSDDTQQHADFLYSFTFDDVSQLDGDVSAALANIREWRNSFIHINRIPSDVLSLIPTHLHDQTDRFNASYLYAVIGVGSSFNTPRYGPVYFFQRARSMREPSSNARN